MIVCHCANVSDRKILELVESGVSSVREVTQLCGAGRCCAPCRDEIASLLSAGRAGAHPSSTVEAQFADL